MLNKVTIKNLYSEIREMLFKMIPEKWDSIYLYASIIVDKKKNETGEMFFYYYPKSMIKKNPINVYEIPAKFNIDENSYMILASRLYELIKCLRHECIKLDNTNWTNITISIENVEFLAEYNFDDLMQSIYTIEDRRKIWEYKYLNYPIERFNKVERNMIKQYLHEEENGQHKTTDYSETFYQKHIHNDIKYNMEHEEYIQEEKTNKSNEEQVKQSQDIKKENADFPQIKNQLLKFNK